MCSYVHGAYMVLGIKARVWPCLASTSPLNGIPHLYMCLCLTFDIVKLNVTFVNITLQSFQNEIDETSWKGGWKERRAGG